MAAARQPLNITVKEVNVSAKTRIITEKGTLEVSNDSYSKPIRPGDVLKVKLTKKSEEAFDRGEVVTGRLLGDVASKPGPTPRTTDGKR